MSSFVAVMTRVREKNPQPEFHQAVEEVAGSIVPVLEANPVYRKKKVFERMVEPERMIVFRVPWTDDRGEVHVQRGYRIEMNSAIGPYCAAAAEQFGRKGNYVDGANIAGFVKVADAMLDQGIV